MAGAGSTLAQHGPVLDDATRRSLAQTIEARAREMSDLISNVLDLTRFESGKPTLRRAWESVDDLAAVALTRVQERLADHLVELRLADDLPPVNVDATLVVQLFTNLFDNFIKHTPAGSHATVRAIQDGDLLRVTVEDDGPGFPPGNPTRLFDKFQRGNGEGVIAGVGLGLAICRAIAQAHGGSIVAVARPEGGARFEFTLPITEPLT
jgi:two-component system sensor histidine kinase KdpD